MIPTAPVLIDFESRSRADLALVGGRRYWEHPSSEALCCVWYDTADCHAGLWIPGEPWPHEGRVLAAHNAFGFDRFGAERYGFGAAAWIDTAQLARKAGLPGALDALGQRWCGQAKDAEASRYTRALSSVRRPREISRAKWAAMGKQEQRERGALPAIDGAVLQRVVAYCASDVAILARAWPRLEEWVSVDAQTERLDVAINDRGVCFDSRLARRLLEEDARVAREAVQTCAAELDMPEDTCAAAARSPAQFCKIAGTPDAQAATIEALLDGSTPPNTAAAIPLARTRQALASIARGKLTAGLARVHEDGRMRDTLLYYGANTGRWSGRAFQPQNLPRPASRLAGVDVNALADEVLAGRRCDAEEIALLLRATITAAPGHMLIARDFASIEARATAWAAGDDDAIEVFRNGHDPYKTAAAAIFRCSYDDVTKPQRQIGKLAELACGYGGGPGAFERIASAYRLDVSALDLRAIVTAWRQLHAPIVRLWYACERAFRRAIQGRRASAGPWDYVPAEDDSGAVACLLPSGRPIVYQRARECADDSLAYQGTRAEEHTYGGKLVENAIQGLCRDLLAHALLGAEAAGLRVVLHVHDEVVIETRDASDADRLQEIMLAAPPWAAGLPVGADGWTGFRYRK